MTATVSAVSAFASLNIGKKINDGARSWLGGIWDKFPLSHLPAWAWCICGGIICAFMFHWVWYRFIR